jgi:hypothetical protein
VKDFVVAVGESHAVEGDYGVGQIGTYSKDMLHGGRRSGVMSAAACATFL